MAVSFLSKNFVGEFMRLRFLMVMSLGLAACSASAPAVYLYPESTIDIVQSDRCTTFQNMTGDILAMVPADQSSWDKAHAREGQDGRPILKVEPCGA